MEPSELDKAVTYTKQFIDAATPIAKQAYEIGLVTLRIDAAQEIVLSLSIVVAAFFFLRKVRGDWMAAAEKAKLPENKRSVFRCETGDHLPLGGAGHFIFGALALFAGVAGIFGVLNVWTWVKLISPQLWLAHRAIEKIIG